MHQPSQQARPSIYYNYQVFKPWLPSQNGPQDKKKAVIVGAGPAGMVTALELARHGVASVVLATDLAARGLDIEKLPTVINFDLPRSAVDYTHRIGRTGRAGESGVAISFVCPESLQHWALIEKRHAVKLPQESIPGYEATTEAPEPLENNGGVKGKRPSKKDKLRQLAASNAEN